MNRSLYSLILMDDVVAEIDRLALRQNTSRSGLVNQILAEYVSLMTPEKRIGSVYKRIEELISKSVELVPAVTARNGSLSMKSSLDYKYRPTIRYEVQLYREPEQYIGELNVIIRTQSQSLLASLTDFFRLLKQLEDAYVFGKTGGARYELYEGRFVRSISLPEDRDYTAEEMGDAISKYIEMLDDLMKCHVARGFTPQQLEERYLQYVNAGVGLI